MESVGHVTTLLLSSVAIYFCASFPALMAALSVSGLCLVSVMIPSYSLLSEICLIRFRSSLASINTLQVGEEVNLSFLFFQIFLFASKYFLVDTKYLNFFPNIFRPIWVG